MNYLEIFSTERPLKIKVKDFEINLKYDATYFTKKNSIISAKEDTLYIDYLATTLSKLIKSWDLTMGEKLIELKSSVLIDLDMKFLEFLYKEIEKDSSDFFTKP